MFFVLYRVYSKDACIEYSRVPYILYSLHRHCWLGGPDQTDLMRFSTPLSIEGKAPAMWEKGKRQKRKKRANQRLTQQRPATSETTADYIYHQTTAFLPLPLTCNRRLGPWASSEHVPRRRMHNTRLRPVMAQEAGETRGSLSS